MSGEQAAMLIGFPFAGWAVAALFVWEGWRQTAPPIPSGGVGRRDGGAPLRHLASIQIALCWWPTLFGAVAWFLLHGSPLGRPAASIVALAFGLAGFGGAVGAGLIFGGAARRWPVSKDAFWDGLGYGLPLFLPLMLALVNVFRLTRPGATIGLILWSADISAALATGGLAAYGVFSMLTGALLHRPLRERTLRTSVVTTLIGSFLALSVGWFAVQYALIAT